jgi:hypothetical protein
MNHRKRCERFLKVNGWKYDPKTQNGCGYYLNGDHCAVDVTGDQIVLIDDSGDFLHLPINYYALVGAMLESKQITAVYKSV